MDTDLHQDLSESNMVFVPADLDDAGLSVHAFRVYCHLARRTMHSTTDKWPSGPSIAAWCRMNEDTVWRALEELIERGMVRREKRAGTSSRHILTKPSLWNKAPKLPTAAPKTHRKRGDGGKEGTPETKGQGAAEKRGQGAAEKRGYEGTPIKVLHEGMAGGSDDPPTSLPPEPVPQHANKKPTRRNFAFDTLAQVDGTDTGSMTPPEASRIGKCLADIRAAWPVRLPEKPTLEQRETYEAALAEEIRRRAARYREVMPHAQLTACALVAHWGKCTPARTTGIGAPVPASGGRWALPAGCDWRGLARTLGIRIAFDTPWHEVGHAHRTAILEAHSRSTLVS